MGDGLWSDDEPQSEEEKTLQYVKQNIMHDGLWSDDEPEAQEEKTIAYKKKNLLHDGLWSDDEVAVMEDAEPVPAVELMEMESTVFVEEEEPENNNFWYFLGGAAVGTAALWLFSGKPQERMCTFHHESSTRLNATR